MTRLLVWNIQQFSWNTMANIQSRNGIGLVLQAVNPDIFCVIEVQAPNEFARAEGVPLSASSNSGQALIALGHFIANNNLMQSVALVPPLEIGTGGTRESVAVFYNSNDLLFMGPWMCQNAGAGNVQSLPPVPAAQQQYPVWSQGLPNTPVPAGYPLAGVPSNTLGAQYKYWDAGGHQIYFPMQNMLGTAGQNLSRPPYLVQFLDLHGRVLDIYIVHTSPDYAAGAIQAMGMIYQPTVATVNVLAGDFNLDFYIEAAGYQQTLAAFTPLIGPLAGQTNQQALARYAYSQTQLATLAKATPFGAYPSGHVDAQHNIYPAFGYMNGAVDNILVAPAPAGATTAAVINYVVGSPANQVATPPGVAPLDTNGPALGNFMAPNAIPLPYGVPDNGMQNLATVQGLGNFLTGYEPILGLSDHLPVYADI